MRRKRQKKKSAETFQLPPVLDASAANELVKAFSALRGKVLDVDASAVERAGALSIQVLLSAAKTWEADAAKFVITNCSPRFAEDIRTLGISESQLPIER